MNAPCCLTDVVGAPNWVNPVGKGPVLRGIVEGKQNVNLCSRTAAITAAGQYAQVGAARRAHYPDGRCSQIQPPCVPKPTLRKWRGRISFVAAASVIALIAVFFGRSNGSNDTLLGYALDPGPLSSLHARFTHERGCVTCHEPHGQTKFGWLKAAFQKRDLMTRCLNCHRFDGPSRLAHNKIFENRKAEVPRPQCHRCHIEHQGANHDLKQVDDILCQHCHMTQINNFADEHPPFAENYPHEIPGTIYFDHNSHLHKHFQEEKFKDKSPDCENCHQISGAGQSVKVDEFSRVCAQCHREEISQSDLVVFSLPELPAASSKQVALFKKSCGSYFKLATNAEDEDYVPVGEHTDMNPLTALLLGVSPTSIDLAAETYKLLQAMAEQGTEALIQLGQHQAGEFETNRLFSGLHTNLLRRAACAWGANREFFLPDSDEPSAGWQFDSQNLRYRAANHEDPIIRSWIQFARQIASSSTDSNSKIVAETALDYLLNVDNKTEGAVPGACGKCHVAGLTPHHQNMRWGYDPVRRYYTKFAHSPHINLLGTSHGCNACHRLDSKADFGKYFKYDAKEKYVSDFMAIKLKDCTVCHSEEGVRHGCTVCHTYHRQPGYNADFQQQRQRQLDIQESQNKISG